MRPTAPPAPTPGRTERRLNTPVRTRLRAAATGLATLAALWAVVAPAAGQSTAPVRGWVFTPAIGYGLNVDDNVLVQGSGEDTRADLLNAVSPRASVDFLSGRSRLSASYDGTALLYSRIPDLNYYDQRATVSARRLVTPHYALTAQNSLALSPTTELIQLVGTPFVRTGSRVNDTRAGVEATLSNVTTMSAAYTFQWISFADDRQNPAVPLQGGHSNGVSAGLRRRLSPTTTFVSDYDMQLAAITGGADRFNVQNGWVGLDQRLTPQFSYSGAIGLSRLGVTTLGDARTGLAWRLGITQLLPRGAFDAGYRRSFVPAYGFGGTVQNEDITTRLQGTLSRRTSVQGTMSWRRNEPLLEGHPSLWSLWLEGHVDYALTRWLRLDTFYSTARQSIDRPGGLVIRNRFGIQLVTGRPMKLD
jgi:hypothetical protein